MFRRIGYRPIPTWRVINGDYQKGMEYIGQAMKQLMQLENSMRFRNLKQLSSTFKDENVVIECWHGSGMSQVTITTMGVVPKGKKVEEQCLCCINCLMVGKITKVHDAPVYYVLANPYYYGRSCRVDVKVCQGDRNRNVYVELLNVLCADRHPDHAVGDRIAVMVNPLISWKFPDVYDDRVIHLFDDPTRRFTNVDYTVNACLVNDPYLRNVDDPEDPYDPTVTGIYATEYIATEDTCAMTQHDDEFAPDWVPYIALSFKCPRCFRNTGAV